MLACTIREATAATELAAANFQEISVGWRALSLQMTCISDRPQPIMERIRFGNQYLHGTTPGPSWTYEYSTLV